MAQNSVFFIKRKEKGKKKRKENSTDFSASQQLFRFLGIEFFECEVYWGRLTGGKRLLGGYACLGDSLAWGQHFTRDLLFSCTYVHI